MIPEIATYVLVCATALGVAKRRGLITIHPAVIKNENARKTFETIVGAGDFVAEKGEILLSRAMGKKGKGENLLSRAKRAIGNKGK